MAGDDGFLSRWARRKADSRQGKLLEEPELPRPPPANAAKPGAVVSQPPVAKVVQSAGTEPNSSPVDSPTASPDPAAPPPLTLEDARALTSQSDFKPFMAQQVQPDVRNAAMKKLFADPHYNVMDGLDTYIDDYTKSDPIPESMLRQMVGAQFLKLFDDEATVPSVAPRDSSGDLAPDSVAQSIDSTEPRLPPDHANTHLRLQPDHAPAGPDIGRGAA